MSEPSNGTEQAVPRLTNEQAEQLSNAIAQVCEDLALAPEQILDGISRTLLSASATFEVPAFTLNIEGVGRCSVEMSD
mgnify:CR=1 FL=1